MKTIVFFNNKGGVGKTSLVYHLAHMFADLGLSLIAADLDPQANLTSMFLEEDRLEELWSDGRRRTIYAALEPLLSGTGDIAEPHVEDVVPGLALVLPLYLLMRQYQLLDNPLGLVVVYLTFTMPYTIWILKNYFQTIPRELEEAAYVDGATWRQAMVRVLLPVSLPGLITVGMFSFMASWGEFFYALLLTTTLRARTMPVEATFLIGELGTEYGFLMAASVLAIIPPLVLALLFQRVIIQGIAAGAVKG